MRKSGFSTHLAAVILLIIATVTFAAGGRLASEQKSGTVATDATRNVIIPEGGDTEPDYSKYANSTYFYDIIDPVNDKPELLKFIPDTTLLSNFKDFKIDLSEYFIDVDGDTLSYELTYDPNEAVCSLDSTGYNLIISGVTGWSGSAGITVIADDGQLEEETTTATFSTKSSPKVITATSFSINVVAFDMLAVTGLETYLKNELNPTIELTNQMEIQSVQGIYTIPGQPEKTINCTETSQGSFKYTGVIPSFVIPTEGVINFRVTDIYGHTDTFGPKTIKWHELELENGLLVNYLFSGNTKNKALNSLYGDAVANGAVLSTDRYTNENRAYSFDGADDYISFPQFSIVDEYTVSVWFKPNTTWNSKIGKSKGKTKGTAQTIYQASGVDPDTFISFDLDYSGSISFNTSFGEVQGLYTQTNEWLSDNWYHIVISYGTNPDDGFKYKKLYVNGKMENTEKVDGLKLNTGGWHGIGRNTHDFTYFNGKIDDVKIYERPLTDYEVQALNELVETNPLNEDLILYLPFDGDFKDYSGNGYTTSINRTDLTIDRNNYKASASLFNKAETDYIQFDNIPVGNAVTFSAWVNLANNGATQSIIKVGTKFELLISSTEVFTWKEGGYSKATIPAAGFIYDNWALVTVTKQGTALKLYVNSNEIYSNPNIISVLTDLNLNSTYFGSGSYLSGKLDEVRLYSNILSDIQIDSLYNMDFSDKTPPKIVESTIPAVKGLEMLPIQLKLFDQTLIASVTGKYWFNGDETNVQVVELVRDDVLSTTTYDIYKTTLPAQVLGTTGKIFFDMKDAKDNICLTDNYDIKWTVLQGLSGPQFGILSKAGSPYLVTGNMTVESGKTWTIEPGVELKFNGFFNLSVAGKLIAEGTETDSITFTSISPEKFTFDNVTTGGGCWNGIDFSSSVGSSLKYCKISNAKAGYSVYNTYGSKNYVGGAIYVYNTSNLSIVNCNIINNYAAYYGAGMYFINSYYANIVSTDISNCKAYYDGGGIYFYYSDNAILSDSKISDCTSMNLSGGGIYLNYSNNTVIDSTEFTNCSSGNRGGCIYASYSNYLSISNSDIFNNTSNYSGGGIYARYSNYIKIDNSNISNNTSKYSGGAVCLSSSSNAIINSAKIELCSSGGDGGGIYATYSNTIKISKSLISKNNSTVDGGGIYFDNSSSAVIDSTEISECSAGANGGAIYAYKSNIINMCNSFINKNNSVTDGGGIYLNDSDNAVIDSAEISECSAGTNGGGIYTTVSNYINIDKSLISKNNSTVDGGGIYFNDSDNAIIDSTEISECIANNSGGAINAYSSSYARIGNSNFNNNRAGSNGGAIAHDGWGYSNIIIKSKFSKNYAGTNGGAIWIEEASDIINNLFVENEAGNCGGVIYDSGNQIIIANNTLSNNKAVKGGGIGIYYAYNEVVENNILFGNTSTEYGSQVSFENESNSNITFKNNDIEGGFEGFGGAGSGVNFIGEYKDNIDADPEFISPDDLHIVSSSPCINAGIIDVTELNLPETDLSGNPRISLERVDIGAYEFQDDGNRVSKVEFSINGGVYSEEISVELICSTLNANIYYTMDGSEPDEYSVLYNEPILVNNITKIKARAFKEGMSSGFTEERIYCIGNSLSGPLTGYLQKNNKPYFVTGDILIENENTLTISSGVELYFMDYYKFDVQGRILAEGSPGDSIKFNSLYMFENSPKWNGILFEYNTENDTSRFNYCKFANSSSAMGGGIYIYASSKIKIENSYLHGNYSDWDGGGLYAEESEGIIIKNNTFESNKTDGFGGGVCIYTCNNSEFVNNKTIYNEASRYGGGIYLYGYNVDNFSFNQNTIFNNNSSYNGGGIYVEDYHLNISNNVISSNGWGGVTIDSCDDMIFSNNIVDRNSGVGIYCEWSSNINIVNNLISNNSESDGDGGIELSNTSSNIINNTIVNNKSYEGAGICNWGGYYGTMNCRNNIIYSNESNYLGQISIYDCESNFYNNDIQGGKASISDNESVFTGTYSDNIDINPEFVTQDDYNLSVSSACINAGTADTFGLNLPEFDLGGNPRICVGKIDIGAYEYQSDGSNIVSNVEFSHVDGVYPSDFNVTLSCSTPDTKIYYTIDGNEPDENSILYSEPIIISRVNIVKAKAFKTGMTSFSSEKRIYCVGNTLSGPISGLIENNNKPYFITGDLLIDDQATATLEPGVEFYFMDACKFDIQGRLLAEGTIADSIKFNSFNFIDKSNKWGGILFENNIDNDTSKFKYCKFTNGKRTESGGAIYITGSNKIKIENSLISGNISNSSGGGIYAEYSESIIFINNLIESNIAENDGGGIYIYMCDNSEFVNNTVRFNKSESYYASGGGIYLNGSSVSSFDFKKNNIHGNTAGNVGGGCYVEQFNLEISENSISSNTSYSGGGVYISGCNDINFVNNIVDNNNASNFGGGIYCYNSNNSNLVNNSFFSNMSNNGGGVVLSSTNTNLANNTIVENKSQVRGSGIYFYYSSTNVYPKITNNIIYFNQSPVLDQVSIYSSKYIPNFSYNDIQGGNALISGGGGGIYFTGVFENNIDADPGYVGQDDYNLSINSPCLNTGTADTLGLNLPEFDLNGNPRISNIIDMGAYENQSGDIFISDVKFSNSNTWCYYATKIALSCETPEVFIYYTLDGTEPDETAILYTDSIPMVNKDVVIKARAYKEGMINEKTSEKHYDVGYELKDTLEGTLANLDCPYFVSDDLTIADTQKLTIEQGTRLEFLGHYKVNVQGAIQAVGAINDSIVFTPYDNTLFYDYAVPNGGWNGFVFNSTNAANDTSRFEYCKIEFSKDIANRSGGAFYLNNILKLKINNSSLKSNYSSMSGGAIYATKSSFELTNSELENNYAQSGQGGGLSIYDCDDKNILISKNILKHNRSDYNGGAINLSGSTISALSLVPPVTISRNIIDHNSNNSGYGGGIYVSSSNAIISDNVISHNLARSGGGCSLSSSNIKLHNNTLTENNATSGTEIFFSNSSGMLYNNLIYNSAERINSISLGDTSSDPGFKYNLIKGGKESFTGTGSGTYFTGQYMKNIDADPLFNPDSTDYKLTELSPCVNTGMPDLSGLNVPEFDLAGNYRLIDDIIDIGAYEYGTAVQIAEPIISPESGIFTDSLSVWIECADKSEVIYYTTDNSEPTISSSTSKMFTDTIKVGNDVNIVKARAYKEGFVKSNVVEKKYYKGGISNDVYGLWTKVNSPYYIKGDITVPDGKSLIIEPGVEIIFGNQSGLIVKGMIEAKGLRNDSIYFRAEYDSAGWKGINFDTLNSANGYSLFSYCSFKSAKTIGSETDGGAIYCNSWSKIYIDYSTFENCFASGKGGAIYCTASIPFIRNNTFIRNTSANGGAVYINSSYSSTKQVISDNQFYKNAAAKGGAIYIYGSNPVMINNTIVSNTAAAAGGAIYFEYSNINIYNNILWNNKAAGVYNQIYLLSLSYIPCDPNFYNNNIQGGLSGFAGTGSGYEYTGLYIGNINEEPYFVDSESGNLRLQPYSLCINKGFENSDFTGTLDYDIDNNLRIFNGISDIGAFEYQGDHFYVETPMLSDNETFHTQNFLLEMYSSTPNTVMYYTNDGSDPDQSSFIYNSGSPVNITSNTLIKVKAFKVGYTPSMTYEKKYYFGRELKGNISGTLYYKDYPYYVTDNINVLTGTSLNISAGADIKFLNPYQLKVTGRLVAEGTYHEPINFSPADTTGFYLDKYYNGGWKGIYFLNSYAEENVLKFTNLKFGKKINTSSTAVEYSGGVLYNMNSKLLVENCKFENSKAYNGGALYLASGINTYNNISNSVFNDNRAYKGGVVYTSSCNDEFINNTIAMNSATEGGGFYFASGSGLNTILTNNIIYSNTATRGTQIYLSGSTSPDYEYNNIQGGFGDFGGSTTSNYYTGIYSDSNLSFYPGFDLENTNDPYSLLNYSPLLNAGKPDLTGYDIPETDIIGNTRIYNGSEVRIDIGAYEYQGEPCGDPIIRFKPSDKIDFSYVQDGKPDSLTLYIDNIGTRPLSITDITFYESNSVFKVEKFETTKESFAYTIDQHTVDSLRIIFTPNAGVDKKYSDIMKISSEELSSVLVVNFSGFGVAGTYIDNGGLVSGEWRKENNPYNVVRDIEVDGDLTIYEGVKVRFFGNTNLKVAENDNLSIKGTFDEKVYLTSADTTGFDLRPDDLNGGWRGVTFLNSGDDDKIDHCVIEYCKKVKPGTVRTPEPEDTLNDLYSAALYLNNSSPAISNSSIRRNRGYGSSALYAVNSLPQLVNVKVYENRSRLDVMIDTYHNKAYTSGSVYLKNSADEVPITNCAFFDNLLEIGATGCSQGYHDPAIMLLSSNAKIINATIAGTNDTYGNIRCRRFSSPTIINSIIWDKNLKTNIYLDDDFSDPDIYNSNISNGTASFKYGSKYMITDLVFVSNVYTGEYKENIKLDPSFAVSDPLFGYIPDYKDKYELRKISSSINAGKIDTLNLNLPEIDLLNNPRICQLGEKRIELGAYEYQGYPAGDPIVGLNKEKIDFSYSSSGVQKTDTLIIYNQGNTDLQISNIKLAISDNAYSVGYFNTILSSVPAHGIDSVKVILLPPANLEKNYDNTLLITTNVGTKPVELKAKVMIGTIVPGGLVSGEWKKEFGPYNIIGNIQVDDKLSIQPGVNVLFRGRYKLDVGSDASLTALGMPTDKITFTAVDTLGFFGEAKDNVDGWGGINIIDSGSDDMLSNCTFKYANSYAYKDEYKTDSTLVRGGAVYCRNSTPVFMYSEFRNNLSQHGGAVYFENCPNGFVSNCKFINNRSENISISTYISVEGFGYTETETYSSTGGAIKMLNSDITISNTVFENNKSSSGGAVYVDNSITELYNNLLFENEAVNGGGIYIRNSEALISNNTSVWNKAKTGGSVYIYRSSPVIINSIYRNNIAELYGKEIYIDDNDNANTYSLPVIQYNNIEGGLEAGIGLNQYKFFEGSFYANMDFEPAFASESVSPFSLMQTSPCINAG